MAALALCSGCGAGQHARHVEPWDNPGPGLLGGAFCPSQGDCKPPALSHLFGPLRCTTCDGTGLVTQDIDRHGRRYINQPVEDREQPCDDCGGTGEQEPSDG